MVSEVNLTDEIVGLNRLEQSGETSWSIKIDGMFLSAITQYLVNDDIPTENIKDIVNNASSILSNCVNPQSSAAKHNTGLVIGKVQSGKTSNFISLAALAFDNGYNIVIVLGGTKKALVKQNTERIEASFNQLSDDVIVLNTTEYKSLVTEERIVQFLENGQKVVIVLLKNTKHINHLKNSIFSSATFINQSILLIDDEGDEASLNTLVHKGKESAIYRSIKDLIAIIPRHSYVSVTATPQANLLIQAIDVLAPEFGVLVDPGEGYCGLDVFHGIEGEYTIPIPDNEQSLLDGVIPDSFLNSLGMFIVGAALRTIRSNGKSIKSSMLIHPSHRIVDLNQVGEIINDRLGKWRDNANNPTDIAAEYLYRILDDAYSCLINQPGATIRDSSIEQTVLKVIKTAQLHVIHGQNVESNTDKFSNYNIYLGGNILGRGLTIKGLITTYIIRSAKGKSNVDTVEQRARWFGYKKDYIDLCRVYATPQILRHFSMIRDHEKDLWETVRIGSLHGSNFKALPRIFLLSDELDMTRKGVASTAKYNFHFWNLQRVYQDNPAYIASNNNVVSSYRDANKSELVEKFYSKFGRPHEILSDRKFTEVFDSLIKKFIFPDESEFNNIVIQKMLDLLLKKGINPVIDIYWMRVGAPAVHPVRDGIVSEYMVGRSPLDLSKPQVYPGDRYITKKDVMQLQIHQIKKKDTDIVSPTLALYLPEDYMSLLTGFVVRA